MPPPITASPTSVTTFIDTFTAGPMGEPVQVGSWEEASLALRGLDPSAPATFGLFHFFANGGRDAWAVRAGAIEQLAAMPVPAGTNLLCIPQLVSDPAGAGLPALGAVLTTCEQQSVFLLLDPPPDADAVPSVLSFLDIIGGAGLRSRNAALYFPLLAPVLPAGPPVPPSGAVAGMIARNDAEVGVWNAPAGADTVVLDARPAIAVDDQGATELAERGVNLLRSDPSSGTFVWGARTLAEHEWKYVAIRRTALFIESSLSAGLTWAVFEPNDEALWSAIRQVTSDFLHCLWQQGAFQGSQPEEAYFVRCGPETMTQDDIDAGNVVVLVGFAPARPAEFVIVRIHPRRPE